MKDFRIKPLLISTTILITGIAIGFYLANQTSTNPAYLIGAATITNHEKLPQYRAVAEPLAHELGGYRVLASGFAGQSAELLEGQWPAEGLLFIERYDSLTGLKAFINSPEFQKAKQLRDQVADVHFMIALQSGDNVSDSGN